MMIRSCKGLGLESVQLREGWWVDGEGKGGEGGGGVGGRGS